MLSQASIVSPCTGKPLEQKITLVLLIASRRFGKCADLLGVVLLDQILSPTSYYLTRMS